MGKTMYEELISAIAGCTADMKCAAGGGRLGLGTQVRAYDLLDRLLEMKDMLVPEPALKEAAEEYCRLYAKEAENDYQSAGKSRVAAVEPETADAVCA